jgi:hypothetical protein
VLLAERFAEMSFVVGLVSEPDENAGRFAVGHGVNPGRCDGDATVMLHGPCKQGRSHLLTHWLVIRMAAEILKFMRVILQIEHLCDPALSEALATFQVARPGMRLTIRVAFLSELQAAVLAGDTSHLAPPFSRTDLMSSPLIG